MIQSKFAFAIVCILLCIAELNAQDTWTLRECIDYAMENNLQIKQQGLMSEVDQNNLLQSRLDVLPSLNANASHGYSFGRALDETTYQFIDDERIESGNMALYSNFTIFSGFQKYNTIKQNEFNLLSGLQDLEKLKNDVSLNIASAYLQILFSHELLEIAKNQLDVTNQQISRTEKLVEAGSLPRGSLLEIQAQGAAEELQVVNSQNQLDMAYLTLVQILELETTEDFEIEIPVIDKVDEGDILLNVSDLFNKSVGIMPEIRSAEYRKQSFEKALAIAQGARSPRLQITSSYGSGYSDARQKIISVDPETFDPTFGDYPFNEQINDNVSMVFNLGISIPIFNGWMVNNNISNAKIQILNSQYALQSQKNILLRDIQQAYADAKASLNKFRATNKALDAMRESFKYTEQRFEVGLINTVDYNTAKNQLAQTESELVQARYEYIFKTKILDFYRGIPIEL